MEVTWSTMEKKEKIVWIKKAAEDQKRYEVGTYFSLFFFLTIDQKNHRQINRLLKLCFSCSPTNNRVLNRETCVRCAHLLQSLPQGRR